MAFNYKVVAFGASAGSIEPLGHILRELPTTIHAALIVVQHLSSTYPSKLDSILKSYTTLPVIKVNHNFTIEPGKVYVIAEGKFMRIVNDELVVRDRTEEEQKLNKAIDIFFSSLAAAAGDHCMGVILSGGGGFDGIVGAVEVEKAGGLIVVQDPYTAEQPILPKALIANDHPDYVLAPHEIAKKIIEYCK
ncbi:chemotaxis protein CheB [Chitinophaga silvisoli]|uniref:protein-glutamate methylesterase n=1 Tax=Chitinophaga silvisoli TaxID=2291814 RepID=A0A3E1NVB5_9BACT|nr:chemotaxis protein CheB [Chitinophaga silvisoli]RFM31859.1 chemotaxis protein CheB [Chitinophaga silvisoli]